MKRVKKKVRFFLFFRQPFIIFANKKYHMGLYRG